MLIRDGIKLVNPLFFFPFSDEKKRKNKAPSPLNEDEFAIQLLFDNNSTLDGFLFLTLTCSPLHAVGIQLLQV